MNLNQPTLGARNLGYKRKHIHSIDINYYLHNIFTKLYRFHNTQETLNRRNSYKRQVQLGLTQDTFYRLPEIDKQIINKP